MNNNQYYGGQNSQQPMYNGYPQQGYQQQPMYNGYPQQGYQQPMYNGYPQQQMYSQSVYGQPMKKSNAGSLILIGVAVIVAICFFSYSSNYSKTIEKTKGEWECKGTNSSTSIILNIQNDDSLTATVIEGKNKGFISSKFKNSLSSYKGKDGYKYVLFKLYDGTISDGKNEAPIKENQGFTFGVKDDEAHYITGDGKNDSGKEYTCTKKNK